MPEPCQCIPYQITLNQIQLFSHELQYRELTVSISVLLAKLKRVIVKSHEEQKHNILIYCISDTKIDIISLH